MSTPAADRGSRFYATVSLCPQCTVVQHKGLQWKQAEVTARDGKVYLDCHCPTHGTMSTLYCADEAFFARTLAYDNNDAVRVDSVGAVGDIEDIYALPAFQRLRGRPQQLREPKTSLPVLLELSLQSSEGIVAEAELVSQIALYKSMLPADYVCIIKVAGRGIADVPRVNERTRLVLDRSGSSDAGGVYLLLELPPDRWTGMAELDDTVLLSPMVYPSVLVYCRGGVENETIAELESAYRPLRSFKGMQIMVSLVLDRPMPDLARLIRDHFQHQVGFVKFLLLSTDRSPREMVESFSVDPLDVFHAMEQPGAPGELTLSRDDFFPVAAFMVLEPFLKGLGYEDYRVRPPSFCGFVCPLVTAGPYKSIPLARLVDIDELHRLLLPIHAKYGPDGGHKMDFFTARKLKKLLKQAARPGVDLPDIVAYLASKDKKKRERVEEVTRNLQFIVVHNTMDLAAVDATRRAACIFNSCSRVTPNGLAMACTGCL